MADAQQETETDTGAKGPAVRNSQSSTDKRSENRMANKQRKKRAHKRSLRRSNTNG
jgi:hypothetical protein